VSDSAGNGHATRIACRVCADARVFCWQTVCLRSPLAALPPDAYLDPEQFADVCNLLLLCSQCRANCRNPHFLLRASKGGLLKKLDDNRVCCQPD
jgi:hypothetical protein